VPRHWCLVRGNGLGGRRVIIDEIKVKYHSEQVIIALLSLVSSDGLLNGLSEVLKPHNTYKNKFKIEWST
jgi:hypothetical protein